MPKPSPRAASLLIASSSSSNSWRSVSQPSMTRNTSPNSRPSGAGGRLPAERGRPSRCRARRSSSSRSAEQGVDLGDDAPAPLGVEPGRVAADVRQPGQGRQRAAAQVQQEELHLARGVGERERADQGAQQRALAALRRADHHDVAGRPGQVGPQQVAALLERLVHDARPVRSAGPAPDPPRGHRPRSSVVSSGGSSWSRVGGSASGGSQIRCAGGPWPSIRDSSASIIDSRSRPAGGRRRGQRRRSGDRRGRRRPGRVEPGRR